MEGPADGIQREDDHVRRDREPDTDDPWRKVLVDGPAAGQDDDRRGP